MKNAEQMADEISAMVRKYKSGVSFVELMKTVGPDAEGDYSMELPPKYVWWTGMSETFVEAIEIVRKRGEIEPTPTSHLVYFVDGKVLRMPLAKSTHGYKKPHWVPMVFGLKRQQEA